MTAKEMFIDLNFRCVRNDDNYITYRDIENEDFYVYFDKTLKVVNSFQTYDYNFNFKMFKAINKQIEELGWDNE